MSAPRNERSHCARASSLVNSSRRTVKVTHYSPYSHRSLSTFASHLIGLEQTTQYPSIADQFIGQKSTNCRSGLCCRFLPMHNQLVSIITLLARCCGYFTLNAIRCDLKRSMRSAWVGGYSAASQARQWSCGSKRRYVFRWLENGLPRITPRCKLSTDVQAALRHVSRVRWQLN